MKMLLESVMDAVETVNNLAKIGLVAADDRADALLMRNVHLVLFMFQQVKTPLIAHASH